MSRNEQVARSRAESFRAEHDLGARPLGDLFELVHTALKCDALAIDADESEHGLSMLDPDTGRVVVAVATTPRPMRQRSSLAHEIGHVVAGDLQAERAPVPGTRSPAEIQADAFARHLLLPVAALLSRFPRAGGRGAAGIAESDLAAVVQEFEVSPGLAAIQLKEAGLIQPRTCTEWSATTTARLATRYGWLTQYQVMSHASARPRAPQELMRRAVEGYHRGIVGLAELASWYGQSPQQLLEQLGPPQDVIAERTLQERVDDLEEDTPLFPAGLARSTPAS